MRAHAGHRLRARAAASPAPARRASGRASSLRARLAVARRDARRPPTPSRRAARRTPRIVPSSRVDSHRRVTTGVQTRTAARSARRAAKVARVMASIDAPPRRLVVGPRLERERALPGRRHERVERARRARVDAEPLEPGGGEHERVDLARGELAQPRVDVAAQLDDLEVGPHGEQLRAPAQRAGADARALAAAPSSDGARRTSDVARVRARAATPTSARARPPARPARPWPSAPRGRSRPPAAPASSAPTQRDLSPTPRAPVARRW